MDLHPIPELINGLPNICGEEARVEEVTRSRAPVYLKETDLRLDRLARLRRSRCTCSSR